MIFEFKSVLFILRFLKGTSKLRKIGVLISCFLSSRRQSRSSVNPFLLNKEECILGLFIITVRKQMLPLERWQIEIFSATPIFKLVLEEVHIVAKNIQSDEYFILNDWLSPCWKRIDITSRYLARGKQLMHRKEQCSKYRSSVSVIKKGLHIGRQACFKFRHSSP